MGGEQHNAVRPQLRDQLPEADPLLGVQSGGGLVQNQQLGPVEQGLGDSQPLLHAAGVGLDLFAGRLAQPHQLQQLPAPRLRPAPVQPLQGRQVEEKIQPRKVGVVAEILGQIAQHPPVRLGGHVHPVKGDGAAGGL